MSDYQRRKAERTRLSGYHLDAIEEHKGKPHINIARGWNEYNIVVCEEHGIWQNFASYMAAARFLHAHEDEHYDV